MVSPEGPPPLRVQAVLFDLDETLTPDTDAARAAFRAVCEIAASRCGVDPDRLYTSARACSRALWHGSPWFEYCLRIGISSWEGLWAGFAGDAPELRHLHRWAPEYRRGTWESALGEQGVTDGALAAELAERFPQERRQRQSPYPGVPHVLRRLGAAGFRLALVTDGAPDLQREKADLAGLTPYFGAIVVSGEVGHGKPDPGIFTAALERLDARPEQAVMVGDNPQRDIAGARGCGIRAVLIERGGAPGELLADPTAPAPADARITDLRQLLPLLGLR